MVNFKQKNSLRDVGGGRRKRMQCEACKLRSQCLNFGNEEIREKISKCTDYVYEGTIPVHTHSLSKSLFRSRDNSVDVTSNDVLGDVDNTAR